MQDGNDAREFAEQYNSSNVDNPRKVVIAAHNSITYQVDGMELNLTPFTYKFNYKGQEVSMAQYFNDFHRERLREKQPLLYVNRRDGERIYLPTQLCHEASLPKNFTKNFKDMQILQGVKLNNP